MEHCDGTDHAVQVLLGDDPWASATVSFGGVRFEFVPVVREEYPGLPELPAIAVHVDETYSRPSLDDAEVEANGQVLVDFLEALYVATLDAGDPPRYAFVPNSTDEEHLAARPDPVELTAADVREGRLPDLSSIHLLPPEFTDPLGVDELATVLAWRRRRLPDGGHLLAFRPGPNRVSDEYLDALSAVGFDG